MKSLIVILIAVSTVICFSCNKASKVNLDDEIQALIQADKSWSEAAFAKDAKRFVEFYDNEGIVIGTNGQISQNKDTILKNMTEEFLVPGYSVSWDVQNATVAKSADIGYTTGFWNMQWNNENGEQMKAHGPYLEIWKKQADGSWKAIVDAFWEAK